MNMRYSGRSICLHIIALCIAWDVRAAVWKELVGLAVPAFKNTAEDGLLHAIFFESKCSAISGVNEIVNESDSKGLKKHNVAKIAE